MKGGIMENFKDEITSAICRQFNLSDDRSDVRRHMAKELSDLSAVLYKLDAKAKQEDDNIKFFDKRI